MSRWRSFVDFWIMRELGQADAVFRNYNIMWGSGRANNGPSLWRPLKRIGIFPKHVDEAPNHIPEVAVRLEAIGLTRPDYGAIDVRLRGWYNWDRIREGEVMKWVLAEMTN